jgi:hypothetical protein
VVFFDALRVKIRDEGLVKNKAVYVALALNPDGEKDILGLWIEQTEGPVGGADEQYILWRRPVERWPGRNAVSQPSGHSPVHAFR